MWHKPECGTRNGPITHYDFIFMDLSTNATREGSVQAPERGDNGVWVVIDGLVSSTTYIFKVKARNYQYGGMFEVVRTNTTEAGLYSDKIISAHKVMWIHV